MAKNAAEKNHIPSHALAAQHPEVCCRKAKGEASGVTYQVRNAAVLIEPALLS